MFLHSYFKYFSSFTIFEARFYVSYFVVINYTLNMYGSLLGWLLDTTVNQCPTQQILITQISLNIACSNIWHSLYNKGGCPRSPTLVGGDSSWFNGASCLLGAGYWTWLASLHAEKGNPDLRSLRIRTGWGGLCPHGADSGPNRSVLGYPGFSIIA